MIKKLIGTGILILAFYGCAVRPYEDTSNPAPGSTNLEVQTIEWINDIDGNCQFYTNNDVYCGLHGTTVYCRTTSETPMDTVITEVDKRSGKTSYGYGIIFCAQENAGEKDPEKQYDFYAVAIYTDKNYAIKKRVMGEWETIQTKKSSDFLYEVTQGKNTIKVTRDASDSFTLSFNGHDAPGEAIQFTDNTGTTVLTGGDYGYIAEIGHDEDFPNTPVDVRFKQLTP